MLERRPGGASGARRWLWVWALLGLVAGEETRAGEVPANALARSLRLDPLFLDSPTLVFRFPQLIASRDSAALAFGRSAPRSELFVTTTGNEYGLGAMMRNRAAGGFAFSQGSYLPVSISPVSVGYSNSNIVQLGGGGRWSAFRGGLTLRGTRYDYETEDVYGPGERRAERQAADHFEAGIGAGLGSRTVTCDVVFEWGRTTYENAALYLSENDTLVTQLDGEPENEAGFALRVAVPAGERLRIVAVGEGHWAEVAWTGQEFRNQRLVALGFTDVSRAWFAGLAFQFATPHLDCVAVHGTFERREQSVVGVDSGEGVSIGRRDVDYATLGLSVQRRLWRALVAQAGLTTDYRRENLEGSREQLRDTRLQASRRELVGDGFSCGLTYSWRTFEFAGSLNLPPQVDLPLGMIDVYVEF